MSMTVHVGALVGDWDGAAEGAEVLGAAEGAELVGASV